MKQALPVEACVTHTDDALTVGVKRVLVLGYRVAVGHDEALPFLTDKHL